MNKETMAIRGWVQNALKGAVDIANQKRKVSDYDRGRIAGIILAYQHVLVETSPSAAGKIPYNAFERRISDITARTPFTISDAMEIYYFCDSKYMLSTDGIMETVIELGNVGLDSYEIKAILEPEIIRKGKWLNRIKLGRRKYDE